MHFYTWDIILVFYLFDSWVILYEETLEEEMATHSSIHGILFENPMDGGAW